MPIDLDVAQHKLGIIEGCLRAYHAPDEAFKALRWLVECFEEADELITTAPITDAMKPASSRIVSDQLSEAPPSSRQRWTDEEVGTVRAMMANGANVQTISDRFPDRKVAAIYNLMSHIRTGKR